MPRWRSSRGWEVAVNRTQRMSLLRELMAVAAGLRVPEKLVNQWITGKAAIPRECLIALEGLLRKLKPLIEAIVEAKQMARQGYNSAIFVIPENRRAREELRRQLES